ncbi:MAG: hypothetical protein QOH46_914 [Solirubrobacteraceae bacterium]|jgi:hypothetical protein|nr:hypothetical protein [Solirubrobacteraceae bacterium]
MTEYVHEMLPLTEPAPEPAQPHERWARVARSRFRPRRVGHDPDDAAAGSRDELVVEVLLLREENARLKAAAHEVPSLGRLIGQARALPAINAAHEDLGDEAAQMLLEGLVLRESILAVCQELERSLAVVKARLVEAADPTAPDGPVALRPVGPDASEREQDREEAVVDGPGEA